MKGKEMVPFSHFCWAEFNHRTIQSQLRYQQSLSPAVLECFAVTDEMRTWERVSTVSPAPGPSTEMGLCGAGDWSQVTFPSPTDLCLPLVRSRSNLLVTR